MSLLGVIGAIGLLMVLIYKRIALIPASLVGVLLLAVTLVTGWMQLQEAPWWKESQAAPILQGALKRLKPALPAQAAER